jgi:enoyl-CoA hydratase
LASPDASETWSALGDAPYLAIDLRSLATASAVGRSAEAIARLAALACPTIGLVAAGSVAPGAVGMDPLRAAVDVVVEGEEELSEVVAAIVAAPFAAATLAQVLRATATLDVAAGLAVESMAYATLQAGPEHARWLRERGAPRSAIDSHASAVRVARGGKDLVVTLARPDRHNAFSARMRDDLAAALGLAIAEPDCAVVLRGEGPSFCSGGDLDEFGTRSDPATAHLIRATRSPARLLAEIGRRTRAELHGACIGAGIELAAWAATVVARPDTFVRLPEVAMGLVPGAGGTVSLPRRIGRQRTALLALTGRRIDATTAREWGLVDRVEAAPV